MPNRKPPAAGGGIVRRAHDRENPYVQISRALANDGTLSLEARGLMLYLLAKPADWQIQMTDLQRAAGCGRDQMKRIMRELETAGYIVRTRSHSERGHWVWESMVYEVPQSPIEPSTENPSMVEPSMVAPSPDKAAIYKAEIGLTTETQKIEETAAPPNKMRSAPLLPPLAIAALTTTAPRPDAINWHRAAVLCAQYGTALLTTAATQAGQAAATARGDKAAAYWHALEAALAQG